MINIIADIFMMMLVSVVSGALVFVGATHDDIRQITAGLLAPVIVSWLFVSQWLRDGIIRIQK